MASDPPASLPTAAQAPESIESEAQNKFQGEAQKKNENEETMTASSSLATEETGTAPPLRETQAITTAALPSEIEQADNSINLDEVDDTMTALTLQERAGRATAIVTATAAIPDHDHDINLPNTRTIILTLDASSPSSSGSSTIANPSPRQSPSPSTATATNPPPAPLPLPRHAEHYIPLLPFALPRDSEPANLAHPVWTLSMRLCNYSPQSIKEAHYFTRSVVYYPDWKTRVISKNEHRLVEVISSSTPVSNSTTDTDTAIGAEADADTDSNTETDVNTSIESHISTRPLWALQLYYGGPAREPWDEVISTTYTGAELDMATDLQDCWMEEILRLITQAQSDEVRANRGREVRVVSDAQLQLGSLAQGEGGDGGQFAVVMSALGQACGTLEEVLDAVDKGGARNWEAVRDLSEAVRRYKGSRGGVR